MRRAWNVRLQGPAGGRRYRLPDDSRELARAHDGGPLARPDDPRRYARGEPLLAVFAQHPLQLSGRLAGQDVGSGPAPGSVHAHVQGGVPRVGEAPLVAVELERGDAEVHEDRVDSPLASPIRRHGGDGVVGRVDCREPSAEAREPFACDLDRLPVAVDADDRQAGESLEEGLRVPAHADGGVDHHRFPARHGGGDQPDALLREDGRVQGAGRAPRPGSPGRGRRPFADAGGAVRTEGDAEGIGATGGRCRCPRRRRPHDALLPFDADGACATAMARGRTPVFFHSFWSWGIASDRRKKTHPVRRGRG